MLGAVLFVAAIVWTNAAQAAVPATTVHHRYSWYDAEVNWLGDPGFFSSNNAGPVDHFNDAYSLVAGDFTFVFILPDGFTAGEHVVDPTDPSNANGMEIYTNGGGYACGPTDMSGRVDIDQVTVRNGIIVQYALRFEAHCWSFGVELPGAVYGEVQYFADGPGVAPVSVTVPPQQTGTASPAMAVTIPNAGSAPMHVDAIVGSGPDAAMFTVTDDPCTGTVIAGGGECTVGVRFSPTSVGTRTATFGVVDRHAPAAARIALAGTATAASFVVSPGFLHHGSTPIGGTAVRWVTVTNVSDASLRFATTFPGLNRRAWRADRCGTSIGAHESCLARVMFAPTSTGPHRATFVLRASDATKQYVDVTGTGAAR
jgi:hypothetical protein